VGVVDHKLIPSAGVHLVVTMLVFDTFPTAKDNPFKPNQSEAVGVVDHKLIPSVEVHPVGMILA